MRNRIRELRKTLSLSQTAFGEQLGVSRDVINNIEQGRNKNDISDIFIGHICKIFNINEIWLRSGEGEMLQQPDNSIVNTIIQDQGLSPASIQIIKNFLSLSQNEQNEFIELAQKVFDIENN